MLLNYLKPVNQKTMLRLQKLMVLLGLMVCHAVNVNSLLLTLKLVKLLSILFLVINILQFMKMILLRGQIFLQMDLRSLMRFLRLRELIS